MSKNIADFIVESLQEAGVKHCYGIPGDTLNFFTDAIRRSPLRWIHVRHEETGGFAAGAEAFLANRLTACAGSCGPGSLHFINGLFESNRNGAPVILIASQLPTASLGTNFPQEVDFKQLYQQCSVYCEQITSAKDAPRKVAEAINAALNKKGVAVLILPVDISKQAMPSGQAPTKVTVSLPRILPEESELKNLAKLINGKINITIFSGYGCQDAHEEVMLLAQQLQAPIVRTSRAKDFFEKDNPYDVGMTGLLGHTSGVSAIEECDVLLLLGTNFAWPQTYPSKATIVQIDTNPAHLGQRRPITLGVTGSIKETITALLPFLNPVTETFFLKRHQKAYQESITALKGHAIPGHKGIIHPQYLTSLISECAASDAIIIADGGSPMVWMLRHIESIGERRTLASLLHGTMANAMPQALGAQAAYPERQVIALSGDGGLTMLMGDLLTTIQEKLPIKIVVFNNSSLFFVEMEQRVEGLLDTYTDLVNPDFSKVAAAMGLWSKRIEKADALKDGIIEWLGQPGPALLDVTVTCELTIPPHISIEQAEGMAFYSTKAILSGRTDDVLTMVRENI